MKKLLLMLVVIIVGLALYIIIKHDIEYVRHTFKPIYIEPNNLTTSVNEVNIPRVMFKDSSVQLLVVPKQWSDIYGSSYESQVNFNIAVLNARVAKLVADVNTLYTKQILKKKGK